MVWGKFGSAFILASVALCAAAVAQPADRHSTSLIEATYAPDDPLSRSVTHAAVASTYVRAPDATMSRQDLLGLMILFSLPNKHHQ